MSAGSVKAPFIIPLRAPVPGQSNHCISSDTFIEVRCETPNTEIFYTTDGGAPDPFAGPGPARYRTKRYVAPFTLIEGRTTVKALAVKAQGNGVSSNIVAKTFHVQAGRKGRLSSCSDIGDAHMLPSMLQSKAHKTKLFQSLPVHAQADGPSRSKQASKSSSRSVHKKRSFSASPPARRKEWNALQSDSMERASSSIQSVMREKTAVPQNGVTKKNNSTRIARKSEDGKYEDPSSLHLRPSGESCFSNSSGCSVPLNRHSKNHHGCCCSHMRELLQDFPALTSVVAAVSGLEQTKRLLQSSDHTLTALHGDALNLQSCICSKCGRKCSTRAQFCSFCGTCIAIVCSNCKEINPSGAKFCAQCGRNIADEDQKPDPIHALKAKGSLDATRRETCQEQLAKHASCQTSITLAETFPATMDSGTQTEGRSKVTVLSENSPARGQWKEQVDHIVDHIRAHAFNNLTFRTLLAKPALGPILNADVVDIGEQIVLRLTFAAIKV